MMVTQAKENEVKSEVEIKPNHSKKTSQTHLPILLCNRDSNCSPVM